jgi:hypothetical protein
MAMSYLVYPGAVHSRLHHAIGAYHLMHNALYELKQKGIEITPAEEQGAKIAILLHDIGHGPFSHALEYMLVKDLEHEAISEMIMEVLNEEFNGALSIAIDIFKNVYPKKFLHQLVSGQLDVDRMDYLTRDSFFSGVVEGMIGCDRILKMLTVQDGELMVEEKGIYTIEEFLVSRRLMYWQVYQHKTVLSAEMTLVRILERAVWLHKRNMLEPDFSSVLHNLLFRKVTAFDKKQLEAFCTLDDTDVIHSIKQWRNHADWTLSTLCNALLNRKLLKLRLQHEPISVDELNQRRAKVAAENNITAEDARFLVFTGEAENSLYDPNNERINILFRDGRKSDIAQVDSPLIHQNLSRPVKKFYICFYQ